MNNLKDKITNYMALIVAIVEGINIYLQAHAGEPFDWKTFTLAIGAIVIGYFTGKKADGTTKSPTAVTEVNAK